MFSVYGSNTELPGSECKMGWFNNPFEQPMYSDLCPSILCHINIFQDMSILYMATVRSKLKLHQVVLTCRSRT